MQFEFDPKKSARTKTDRGIDFGEARALWADPELLEFRLPFDGETRFMAIGRIGPKLWTAIFTLRAGKIRIISVRRSRASEAQLYEKD